MRNSCLINLYMKMIYHKYKKKTDDSSKIENKKKKKKEINKKIFSYINCFILIWSNIDL